MMRSLTLAAAMLTGVPMLAQAQRQPDAERPRKDQGGGGRGLLRADTNGDGAISRDEAKAQADERFAMLDADKHGVLTAAERTGPGARMLERADTDGDGKVTKAEYDALGRQRFDRIDANHDGVISADELQAMMQRGRDARGGPGRTDPADAVAPAPPPRR